MGVNPPQFTAPLISLRPHPLLIIPHLIMAPTTNRLPIMGPPNKMAIPCLHSTGIQPTHSVTAMYCLLSRKVRVGRGRRRLSGIDYEGVDSPGGFKRTTWTREKNCIFIPSSPFPLHHQVIFLLGHFVAYPAMSLMYCCYRCSLPLPPFRSLYSVSRLSYAKKVAIVLSRDTRGLVSTVCCSCTRMLKIGSYSLCLRGP
jgi:hypothetical protein